MKNTIGNVLTIYLKKGEELVNAVYIRNSVETAGWLVARPIGLSINSVGDHEKAKRA